MDRRRPRSPYLPETMQPSGLLLTRDGISAELAERTGPGDGANGHEDRRDALSARTAPVGAWNCAIRVSDNETDVSLSIFANVLDSKHDDAARTLHRTPQRETIALGDPGVSRPRRRPRPTR